MWKEGGLLEHHEAIGVTVPEARTDDHDVDRGRPVQEACGIAALAAFFDR